MPDQSITKPNAATFAIEDIVAAVLEGRVRIPDFQRKFRWQWEDVRRLLDSIVRGYPIGSLLLWQRPAQKALLHLGALKIDAPQTQEALWVVDGQQRLTSLSSTLNEAGSEDARFAASYNLADGAFEKQSNARLHSVPLPIIFDLQKLLRWFSERPESSQYFDEATGVAKAIRQYTIPAYIVKQQDESVLRDIFDRMNNYGKRLTRAEVFSALHAGDGKHGPPHTFSDIVEHIDSVRGFGELDEDTVLRGVLARRGPDVTRDIRIEFDGDPRSETPRHREFLDESVDEAYRGGEAALERAVTFLQEDAGVPHVGFLTYRYLLVVLTRFFAHHPQPAVRNRELLRRWYWRASMAGPEKFGGWTQAMRALTTHVDPADESQSVQALIKAVDNFPLNVPRVGKFRTTAAYSRMLLCAMWAIRPRSVTNGEPYDRSMLTNALHGRTTAVDIVHKFIRREPDGFAAHAANRFILLGEELLDDARNHLVNPPPSMSRETRSEVLESHCLDLKLCSYLANGDSAKFLEGRQKALTRTLTEFLTKSAESNLEDTPPLDSLEVDEDDDI
ncbi:MAG: DUF262 domain-containing protein [Myxococcota bacterium]